ncbi:YqzM family protein [Lysinibacillus sp. 54212]|uniref:YqzM family protein n=1 Tax=Lysinibacillus sp. 54212 TaxID=3119829 RepID=UPI002FCADCE9
MAGHQDPNYVAENPFEGRGRASQRNDAIDAGVGFAVSFGFFATMFIIAMIVEVATR